MQKRVFMWYIVLVLLAGILFFLNYLEVTGYASLINDQTSKFIVSLDISPDQQKIKPGQNLLLEVVIREIGGTLEETSIVELEYSIKDSGGNIISSKKESGVIAVKQSEVTNLLIPTSTKPGVYTANVDMNHAGYKYGGSKTFEVVSSEIIPLKGIENPYVIYGFIGLIILVLLI